jgi:hypothetical protein
MTERTEQRRGWITSVRATCILEHFHHDGIAGKVCAPRTQVPVKGFGLLKHARGIHQVRHVPSRKIRIEQFCIQKLSETVQCEIVVPKQRRIYNDTK